MTSKGGLYKRLLKKNLYFSKMLSCADLSLLTNKSIPYTTRYLNELIEEGSVIETGFANSTGGRRPQIYSLQSDLGYIVTVSMDQLITKFALLDLHNNVIGEIEEVFLPLQGNQDAVKLLEQGLKNFIKSITVDHEKIVGVGISMPGFVDVKKGINHSFLPIQQNSLVEYLESGIHLPVLIDNDSSVIGLAEMRLGSAKGHKNVMVVNINWGVGLGVILNGELFRGNNGFAGEFSHIPVFKDNKKICSCGKTGCLETETSLLAIIEKAKIGMQNGRMSVLNNIPFENAEQSCNAIIEAAIRGDTFAVELISEAGYNLGLGIAILITLFNPELIILSGRGAAAGKLWLAPIQQAINEHCIPKIAEDVQIKISNFGRKVDLIGAAALVMEHYEEIETVALDKLKTA